MQISTNSVKLLLLPGCFTLSGVYVIYLLQIMHRSARTEKKRRMSIKSGRWVDIQAYRVEIKWNKIVKCLKVLEYFSFSWINSAIGMQRMKEGKNRKMKKNNQETINYILVFTIEKVTGQLYNSFSAHFPREWRLSYFACQGKTTVFLHLACCSCDCFLSPSLFCLHIF